MYEVPLCLSHKAEAGNAFKEQSIKDMLLYDRNIKSGQVFIDFLGFLL